MTTVRNKILFWMMCLVMTLYPLNYELGFGLRPVDLVVVLLAIILLTSSKIYVYHLILPIFFLVITVVSTALSGNAGLDFNIARYIFFYKYAFIFIVIWSFFSLNPTNEQLYFLEKNYFSVLIFLAIWAISQYFIFDGTSSQPRVSMPFTDRQISDAHLFSTVLSFGLLSYILYFAEDLSHPTYIRVIVMATISLALMLCGSRSGIAILFVGFMFYVIATNVIKISLQKIINLLFLTLLILVAVYFFWSILGNHLVGYEGLHALYLRIGNFDFSADQSSLDRVAKLLGSIDELIDSNSYIFGVGIFNARETWYDGIHSLLLVHFGLIGLTSLIIVLIFYITNLVKSYGYSNTSVIKLLSLLVACIVANIITEYILVSRAAAPMILAILLVYWRAKVSSVGSQNRQIQIINAGIDLQRGPHQ